MDDYITYAVLVIYGFLNIAILVILQLNSRRADREYEEALRRIQLGEKR